MTRSPVHLLSVTSLRWRALDRWRLRGLLGLLPLTVAVFVSAGAVQTTVAQAQAWTPTQLPNPSDTLSSTPQPEGISCATASTCVAVGWTFGSQGDSGLIEELSGGTWRALDAPTPSGSSVTPAMELDAVACPASGFCVAIGTYNDNNGIQQGLIETMSAKGWKAAKAPVPSSAAPDSQQGTSQHVYLTAISCPSAKFCEIVGRYFDNAGHFQPLVVETVRKRWQASDPTLPSDGQQAPHAVLQAVSCAGASSCTAVGWYGLGSGGDGGLIISTSKIVTTVTEAPLPSDSNTPPYLNIDAVDCHVRSVCIAVGTYGDATGNQQGLLLSQGTSSWSAIRAGISGESTLRDPYVTLDAIACTSDRTCTVAGTYTDDLDKQWGAILTYSGGSWTELQSPLPGDADVDVNPRVTVAGISCPGAGSCVVVGSYAGVTPAPPPGAYLLSENTSSSWEVVQAPVPSNTINPLNLVGVSCPQPGACIAIAGFNDTSTGPGVMAESGS